MLALEDLLLRRGVGVTLVVTWAGDAGRGAAVVLVNILGIAATLVIYTATVRALTLTLALSLTLRG